ncbi:putative APS6 [Seiridium cardinale]|uniref:APS6 n=1 Tax=Seiridium cardinale TaxID=138064 RepID=A0ABR2XXW3_9PEZI
MRSAVRLNVFNVLADKNTDKQQALTTESLAAHTTPPCKVTLFAQLLRCLCSPLRLVVGEGPGLWKATPDGMLLADAELWSPCEFYFDAAGSAFQALPTWITRCCQARIAGDSEIFVTKTAFGQVLPEEEDFVTWL